MAFDGGPITEAEWAEARRQSVGQLPPQLAGMSLPDILMPSQKALLRATAANHLVVSDKSRRIGFTWAVSADAVLTSGAEKASGGMDTLYIGYNLDMAREFIDTCAMWAKAFMPACTAVAEYLFVDQDDKGVEKHIQAFRISFASGYEIVALSSRPRSLRGRQGYVILDEFAFHDDAPGLLKAAMALLIWGGKVLVISTHNGVDNPFNELINEIRSGKKPGAVVRCTFDQALEEGLYQRVCLMTGRTWSPEAEAAWRSEIRAHYGADAAEELDCIPSQGSGVYLTRALIEACATSPGPVLRLHCPAGFEMKPEAERRSYVDAWLEQSVVPVLETLDSKLRHFFGLDFARSGDVSMYAPIAIERMLKRTVPFVVEMRNVPFEQQKQVVFFITWALPNFGGGKLDSTGNGAYLGEVTMQEFGASLIEQVKFSQDWWLNNMPPVKQAFEDRMMAIPAHVDLVDDMRQVKMVRGVPLVPQDIRTKGSDGLPRHGDFAPTLALALAASRGEVSLYQYQGIQKSDPFGKRGHDDDDAFLRRANSPFEREAAGGLVGQLRGGGCM